MEKETDYVNLFLNAIWLFVKLLFASLKESFKIMATGLLMVFKGMGKGIK